MAIRREIARLRAEEDREELAILSRERAMEAEERELERAMRAFEEDADQAKRFIEAELRTEHWGREPPRPPAWKVHENGAEPSTAAEPDQDDHAAHRRHWLRRNRG